MVGPLGTLLGQTLALYENVSVKYLFYKNLFSKLYVLYYKLVRRP
jgi:hypothetical protein